jgi:polar amino acid transport system substrate-binding protein
MKKHLLISCSLVYLLTACLSGKADARIRIKDDKLAEVHARGTLIIATDGNYPPQSYLNPNALRDTNTKCEPTQYTARQFSGFDADVAKEIARGLGVEACFVTPPWSQLIAGNWQNNWDVHVGSVTITFERMKVLYFSRPYFATPVVVLVRRDDTSLQSIEDLSGKRIGVCSGCTFESYVAGALKLPGQEIAYRAKDAIPVAYENEAPAIEDLSHGDDVKLDALITQLPVANRAIKNGEPLRLLDGPLFFAYASVTVDRISARDPQGFLDEINRIIRQLHENGKLSELSIKYHGMDLTKEAAQFNMDALQEQP